jgi:hypothetical protein
MFAQMVNERGLRLPDGTQLAPPGSIPINGMVLLEPVATGVEGDLSLPANVKGQVLAVTAQDEHRSLFRLADYSQDKRVLTVAVPGNHCGVGGGYDKTGTAAAVRQITTGYLQNSGLGLAPVPEGERLNAAAPLPIYTENYRIHMAANGDIYGTPDSPMFIGDGAPHPDMAWAVDAGSRHTVRMPVEPSQRTQSPHIIAP